MSELDRKFHKESRRNSLPKDQRFCVKVREVNVSGLKEKLEREEIEEELRYFRMHDLTEEFEGIFDDR